MSNELVLATPASRIIVILHPNTERAEIVLNDRKWNNERYCFSRESTPMEEEALFLTEVAETSKNRLHLEIAPGMRVNEWFPGVLRAIFKWAGKGYRPTIELDNRRYEVDPEYDHDGWMTKKGVREAQPVNLGVDYVVYEEKL